MNKNMETILIKEREIAKDIVNTILYFRENNNCFPYVEDMEQAIKEEAETRCHNKIMVVEISKQMIREMGEWYDKEE